MILRRPQTCPGSADWSRASRRGLCGETKAAASVAVQPEIDAPRADVAMPRFETLEIVRPIAISKSAEPADATLTSARKSKTTAGVATKGTPSESVKETPPAEVTPPAVDAVATASTREPASAPYRSKFTLRG